MRSKAQDIITSPERCSLPKAVHVKLYLECRRTPAAYRKPLSCPVTPTAAANLGELTWSSKTHTNKISHNHIQHPRIVMATQFKHNSQ